MSTSSSATYEEMAAMGATGLGSPAKVQAPIAPTAPVSAPAVAPSVAPSVAAPLPISMVAPSSAPVAASDAAPHIALLLPGKSPALARAAEALQQGFQAAAGEHPSLPVRIYASSDEGKEAVTLYRQALVNGAVAVAGPLTRPGVAALATYPGITVPTLALNVVDTPKGLSKLYFFGLPVETEARQIAQLATAANLHDATIIRTETPLGKRLAAAFAEEWQRQGGRLTAEVVFNGDTTMIGKLPVAPWPKGMAPKPVTINVASEVPANQKLPDPVAPGNMVFLATEPDKARLLRPYLNPSLPIYATSYLFKGNSDKLLNFDLNDIRFVDMPWMLQPDHPAVMIYPRSATPLDADMERLYALGIDAYRLLNILLTNRSATTLPLDGVTGQLSLENQQFKRKATPAFFKQGMGLTPETLAALNAAKAAARAAAKASEVAPAGAQ